MFVRYSEILFRKRYQIQAQAQQILVRPKIISLNFLGGKINNEVIQPRGHDNVVILSTDTCCGRLIFFPHRDISSLCLRFLWLGPMRCEIYEWYSEWTRKNCSGKNVPEERKKIFENRKHLQLIWIYWHCFKFRYSRLVRRRNIFIGHSSVHAWWKDETLIIDPIMNQFKLTIMAIYNPQQFSRLSLSHMAPWAPWKFRNSFENKIQQITD